jgi:hypothetical protein
MEQNEKDKRNEAIALYMGGEFKEVYWGGKPEKQFMMPGFHISEGDVRQYLKYDSSWDWLMPVCKKMSEEIDKLCDNKDLEEWPVEYLLMEDELLEYNIEGVFKHLSDLCQKLNN